MELLQLSFICIMTQAQGRAVDGLKAVKGFRSPFAVSVEDSTCPGWALPCSGSSAVPSTAVRSGCHLVGFTL